MAEEKKDQEVKEVQIEELEEHDLDAVAGGRASADLEIEETNGSGCNGNCPC